jgi:hypothetical protein
MSSEDVKKCSGLCSDRQNSGIVPQPERSEYLKPAEKYQTAEGIFGDQSENRTTVIFG